MLLLDEYQDLAPGSLPVLMEIMSHSNRRQVVITGTPKHVDNPLESALSRSTNCEWLVACACGNEVRLNEEVITPDGYVCQTCDSGLRTISGRRQSRDGMQLGNARCWPTAHATQDAAEADDHNVHQQVLPIPRVTRIRQRFEMRPERTDIHTQLSHATLPGPLRFSTPSKSRRQIPNQQLSRQLAYTTQLCALAVS